MKRIASWLLGTRHRCDAAVRLPHLHVGPATAASRRRSPPGPGSRRRTPAVGRHQVAGSAGSGTASTVTGAVASTRWGPVQVPITVADGKITAVDVPQYPTGNGKDRQINASALPILTKETLSAQSANIDMVSGATVTSEGYVQSLQSALDQAGL